MARACGIRSGRTDTADSGVQLLFIPVRQHDWIAWPEGGERLRFDRKPLEMYG
jgi:hypothetical protein